MTVTIDKFGRIVIPKALRDRLGLHAGSKLDLDVQEGNRLSVEPVREQPLLEQEGRLTVYTGTWVGGETDDTLQRVRDERDRKAMGLSSPR